MRMCVCARASFCCKGEHFAHPDDDDDEGRGKNFKMLLLTLCELLQRSCCAAWRRTMGIEFHLCP